MLSGFEYRAHMDNIIKAMAVRPIATIADSMELERNNINPSNNMIRGVKERQVNDPSLIFVHWTSLMVREI